MEFEFFITSFVALFIIIDPIGITPVFIALTQGMGKKVRRRIALRSIAVSAFVISLFIIFGETVLGFIGISMPVFRIAGGIVALQAALADDCRPGRELTLSDGTSAWDAGNC